jgi:membrane protease YdiL (CAAX protease family)
MIGGALFLRALRALGIGVFLLVATYLPAFEVAHLLRLPIAAAVPVVIVTSLLVSIAIITVACRRQRLSASDFGFSPSSRRYVVLALLIGTPAALVAAWIDHRFGGGGPLTGVSLPTWKLFVYFVVGAPLQEETIFRGLIQTIGARSFPDELKQSVVTVSGATLVTALLFGVVHFEVSLITAILAFLLGVITGEFRRRSRSLVPSIVVHSLFNAASILFVQV